MREVDLLVVLVIFVHRKIDDPAEFEHVLLDEPKHLADPRPGRPCKFGRLQFLACCKENAVIVTKTQRLDQFRGLPVAVVRSEEHTSELQSLMSISYDVFYSTKKTVTSSVKPSPATT